MINKNNTGLRGEIGYRARMKIFTFTLWFLGIALLAVFAMIPNLVVIENNADKMLHVTGFCFLMLWPVVTFKRVKHVYLAAVFLLSAGVLVEVLQGFAPTRTPSFEDVLANVIGVVAGLVIGFLIRSDTARR